MPEPWSRFMFYVAGFESMYISDTLHTIFSTQTP